MQEHTESKVKNFLIRTAAGAVLTGLIVLVGWLGGYVMFAFAALTGLMGLFEFYRMFDIHTAPVGLIGYAAAVLYLVCLLLGHTHILITVLVLGVMCIMVGYVFAFHDTDAEKAMAAATGLVLVLVPLSYLYRVRMMEDGLLLFGLIFICSWGCDICAYCFGMLFGKHHMTPLISPHKTVEGAVGGLLGVAALAALYGFLFTGSFNRVTNPVAACMILCIPGALISMVGDLTFSAFKRNKGIKDYSNLIPGHGGILDRFDSVIFVAPVIYLIGRFFVEI